ncbi:MAG TPA: hypothetical protein VIX80_00475 [Candidatus Kapabacteria bacterium]
MKHYSSLLKVCCILLLSYTVLPFSGQGQCVNPNSDDHRIGDAGLAWNPYDLLHIRYKPLRTNCYTNANVPGSGLRLDYYSGAYFGQLSLIDAAGTFAPKISNWASAKDLVLRASCKAEDIILNTQSPLGAMRFVTTRMALSDDQCPSGPSGYPTVDPLPPPSWTQRESMTILPNGSVGIGQVIPKDQLHISEPSIIDNPATPNMIEGPGNILIGAGNWGHVKSNSSYNPIDDPVGGTNPDYWQERRIQEGVSAALAFIPGEKNKPETSGGISITASRYDVADSGFYQDAPGSLNQFPNLGPNPGEADHGNNLWLSYRNLELWHGTRGVQFRVVAPISHQSSDAGTGWAYFKSRTLIGTEGPSYSGNLDLTGIGNQETLMLGVNGLVLCKELIVKTTSPIPWPDYVFNADYQLMPLDEVEEFVNTNGHLPDVPSASDIETQGVHVVDMQATLLTKIEELTLYVIQLKKEITELKSK